MNFHLHLASYVKKFITPIVLTAFALLISKHSIAHFQHNAGARRLLAGLQGMPLPRNAHPLYELSEVGNYFSATGDATDILAYRAFTTDLPTKDVTEFLAPHIKQLSKQVAADVGVFRLDEKPPLYDTPIDLILKHCPAAERSHTYILYSVDSCSEDGLWDTRGW
jgi:hypothetical protein